MKRQVKRNRSIYLLKDSNVLENIKKYKERHLSVNEPPFKLLSKEEIQTYIQEIKNGVRRSTYNGFRYIDDYRPWSYAKSSYKQHETDSDFTTTVTFQEGYLSTGIFNWYSETRISIKETHIIEFVDKQMSSRSVLNKIKNTIVTKTMQDRVMITKEEKYIPATDSELLLKKTFTYGNKEIVYNLLVNTTRATLLYNKKTNSYIFYDLHYDEKEAIKFFTYEQNKRSCYKRFLKAVLKNKALREQPQPISFNYVAEKPVEKTPEWVPGISPISMSLGIRRGIVLTSPTLTWNNLNNPYAC